MAVICATVSYALMNLVMTSTPLAVVGCGLSEGNAADIVTGHVLAMFAPSFITGHLIARFGVEKIVATGLVILAAAGMVALQDVDLENFFVALILLGWAGISASSARRRCWPARMPRMNAAGCRGSTT